MTKVINLFGGPGAGKSTRAAELYAIMKTAGLSVELVREYVKDWAWEEKRVGEYDQLYILGKQAKKESILYGKVDFIITDSPVILSGFYGEHYRGQTWISNAALSFMELAKSNDVQYYNFNLKRFKPYVSKGRYESEEQARNIDSNIKDYLTKYGQSIIDLDMEDNQKSQAILAHFIPFHTVVVK